MSNEYAGYAHQIRNGWWAMLRFARDSHPKPIMGERGAPIVFDTELDALKAVNKHLLRYLNFPIVAGEGGTLSIKEAHRQKAEKIFAGGTMEDIAGAIGVSDSLIRAIKHRRGWEERPPAYKRKKAE